MSVNLRIHFINKPPYWILTTYRHVLRYLENFYQRILVNLKLHWQNHFSFLLESYIKQEVYKLMKMYLKTIFWWSVRYYTKKVSKALGTRATFSWNCNKFFKLLQFHEKFLSVHGYFSFVPETNFLRKKRICKKMK